jgi:squalene-hopene/tetraprenyl-beta-curcumene cyclase
VNVDSHIQAAERDDALQSAIQAARDALLGLQAPQGYWDFPLEADCTIPAEYVIMMHFLGDIDAPLQARLAAYLRDLQLPHGGWPLYYGGDVDVSCSVKSYFALKLAGDDCNAPHMMKARAAILQRGGAAHANVFTRILLAMFEQVPWRAAPCLPVELMLLPAWFPFHLYKVSYWSRTVMVPLLILCSRRARACNPGRVSIAELFTTPPFEERHYFRREGRHATVLARLCFWGDRLIRLLEPAFPTRLREKAMRRAHDWMCERLNGEAGLGAIFPAMVNALEALAVLGYPPSHPLRVAALRALQRLLIVDAEIAYCQPCNSAVWDTALSALALQKTGGGSALAGAARALAWLEPRQLVDAAGDWQVKRPHLRGGGWPFQFENSFYPDLDDTAVVVLAMHHAPERARYSRPIARALDWLVGMQSRNGGFAAFDVDNTHEYLNAIPFADHGALLDPPTSDVTARVVTALARVGREQDIPVIRRAIRFLRENQEREGSWFGRWGTNYIYGTWSVLTAFAQAGISPTDPAVNRAVAWLESRQNADGGWGESNDSYLSSERGAGAASTPFQTAWAMLALIAAGRGTSAAVARGAAFLVRTQLSNGLWDDPHFTAPGFPRVFYLKYHGYCAYFPLWALSAYRNACAGVAA